MFVSYEKVNELEPMFMGNETSSKIEGKGKVILKLTSGKDLVLSNVLHVPNITKNLISGPILSNKGFKLVIESDKLVITKGGVYVGKGYLDEGLFKLSVVTDDNVINNNNAGTSTASVYMIDPSFLWHSRLGHINFLEYYGIFLIGITYTRLMCGSIFGNQMAKFSKILMNKDMFTTEMNTTGTKLCVPEDPTLREALMTEAHSSPLCSILRQSKVLKVTSESVLHHPLFYAAQGVRYRKLEVILTTNVDKLGKAGETVKVAPGHFRNHLMPKLLAVPNIDKFAYLISEQRKIYQPKEVEEIKVVPKTEEDTMKEYLKAARRLEKAKLVLRRYIKIDTELRTPVEKDEIISEVARQLGVRIEPENLQLTTPLSALGEFAVPLQLPKSLPLPEGKVEGPLDADISTVLEIDQRAHENGLQVISFKPKLLWILQLVLVFFCYRKCFFRRITGGWIEYCTAINLGSIISGDVGASFVVTGEFPSLPSIHVSYVVL
ncbi:ribosomal protein L9/RNase H1 [Tanacetum coccineum]|uniref:Large ribosomal subunit protein bL9c n=1 Tax=Tanacetum coccineum TaxID=301880 RepID=A0ABQ5CZQ6_9ASTR